MKIKFLIMFQPSFDLSWKLLENHKNFQNGTQRRRKQLLRINSSLCAKIIFDARNISPLQFQCLGVYNICISKAMRKKNFEFSRWPSELPANLCRPICPPGLISWHWFADNFKGHLGNSKFNAFTTSFYYFRSLENEFLMGLFF